MAKETFPVDGAILGAIQLSPARHGYALQNWLTANLGSIWRIAPSRLYATLNQLEKRGLIRGEAIPQAGRPPRRAFTLTPAGENEFWSWATAPVRHLRDVRVEFLAKIYFLHQLAPEQVSQLISEEIAVLERIRSRLARRKKLRVTDEFVGQIAISFRLGQLQATIDWLHNCAQQLEKEE